jgi:hypothetical protein
MGPAHLRIGVIKARCGFNSETAGVKRVDILNVK